jgi:hypothetical protein
MYQQGGPFLAMRGPFITASGGGASVASATAEVTGATEITFNVEVSPASYAGIEWGVSPDYTWSAFSAFLGNDHEIIIDAADGVVAGTTYAWRSYATSDPLDAPGNRVYGIGGTVAVPSAIDADAQAIIDEIETLDTTTLNSAQIAAINDFVVGAKAITVGASTAWVECEKIFCAIRATANSDTTGSARLNWKAPTGTKWAKTGTVTFSQLAGSLGQYLAAPDAITSVDNLGGKYTQNNASYGVYCGSEGAAARGNTYGAGSFNDASSRLSLWRSVDNNTVARINGTTVQTLVAATTAIGFHHVNRTTSTAIQYYRNGTLADSQAGATSSALPAQPFAICQAASVEDLCNRYSFAWYGSDMSTVSASWSTLCTALMTDLQAA